MIILFYQKECKISRLLKSTVSGVCIDNQQTRGNVKVFINNSGPSHCEFCITQGPLAILWACA